MIEAGSIWRAKETEGDSPKDYIRIVEDLGYNAFSVAFLKDDGDRHTLFKKGIMNVYVEVDKKESLKKLLKGLL